MQSVELSKIIYEKGCVQAGEEWIEHNLIIISTAAIVVMFFQVSVNCSVFSLFNFFISHFNGINLLICFCYYRYWEFVLPRTCVPIFILRNRNGTDKWRTLPPQHFEEREKSRTIRTKIYIYSQAQQ